MTQIALQLYTVREECAADLRGALATTASLGFDGVELHDLYGRSAETVRSLLDARGLVVCGRHTSLDAIDSDLGALVREAHALGTDRLVVAWIDPPATSADADAAVERLLAASERATRAGIRLGFHNHWGELAVLDDGQTLLDRLLGSDASPFLELDLGWAWYAGSDPVALVERAHGRAPLLHVKDMRRNGGPVHVPLGDGDVSYAGLRDAADDAGVDWLIVEQDETDGPAFAAVERSIARLRTLLEVGS